MTEFFIGTITGLTTWWAFLGALLVGCFLDDDWPFVRYSLLSIICYIGMTLLNLWPYVWWCAAAYTPIGIVWSIYRFDRHCAEILKRDFERYELDVGYNARELTHWITCWPMSLLNWLLHDLVNFIHHTVEVRLAGVYGRIANKHIAAHNSKARRTEMKEKL